VFKPPQRQSDNIAVMKFGAERVILTELEPQIVQLVYVFGPKARRVRAQVHVGGWPIGCDDLEREWVARLRKTLPG
jgi:hypothetical protein